MDCSDISQQKIKKKIIYNPNNYADNELQREKEIYKSLSNKINNNSLHEILEKMINIINAMDDTTITNNSNLLEKLEISEDLGTLLTAKIINDHLSNKGEQPDFFNDMLNMKNQLIYKTDNATIYFIHDNNPINREILFHIAVAVHIFAQLFKCDLSKLSIFVGLTNQNRNIYVDKITKDMFSTIKQKSEGLTVSGMTIKHEKTIILTKKEEIVKLLFHELAHYIGLDNVLNKCNKLFNWDVDNKKLNVAESYAEFISVVLNTAFNTCVLIIRGKSKEIKNINNVFNSFLLNEIEYSIYLTARILNLYGYDETNYREFFNSSKKKNSCPIYIWEYVFLRTQLLFNIDKVIAKSNNFYATEEMCNMFEFDEDLMFKIGSYLSRLVKMENISFLYYDINLFYKK